MFSHDIKFSRTPEISNFLNVISVSTLLTIAVNYVNLNCVIQRR